LTATDSAPGHVHRRIVCLASACNFLIRSSVDTTVFEHSYANAQFFECASIRNNGTSLSQILQTTRADASTELALLESEELCDRRSGDFGSSRNIAVGELGPRITDPHSLGS
jgi:hypothetical protein